MNTTLMSVTGLLILAILLLISAADRRAKLQNRRIARLERKIDLLSAHTGLQEPEDPAHAEIDELLGQGKKIQAIKRHRELTGSGLAEAKTAVERRMR
ncbi:hypothetical protein [Streptomyces sp. NPDC048644]|uniref:hypothetical protein n=1 Tax=Streptomyces sp. NPDC048644 TaxID=3365582 RepID=UPI00371B162B